MAVRFSRKAERTEYSFAISLIADMKGIYLMAVKVIGAGLAGCEAAWQLAQAGIDVELYEMKPKKLRLPINIRALQSLSAQIH